jgi:periplasmic glucans biosynthesis protein
LTAILLVQLAAAAAGAPADQYPIDQNAVIVEARRLAAAPYAAAPGNLPGGLEKLSAEQYRNIRFSESASIWKSDKLPFTVGLLPAGFFFQSPVRIALVDGGVSHELATTPRMFELGANVPASLNKIALPFSGVTLRSHLNSRITWDEFMRFQGASYFRAIAKGQVYGLSARGLAVNIAEPMGEEFPAFTRFWIEKPGPDAESIVVHALLDSPSVTGAYQFTVQPGNETIVDVDVTLFARTAMRALCLAPLTSMFLFDETNRNRRDDYRPEVHDSDGLQITAASGEPIWRPLANPVKLQISAFTTEAPRGFGLMQRSRSAADYQDMDSQYERRPSVWVEPKSDWGPGAVELVELPTTRETNDNITAFWRPAAAVAPGKPWHIAYRLTWNSEPKATKGLGRVIATRAGSSADGNRRVYMIDFSGSGEKVDGLRVDLSASAGRISNLTLVPNPTVHGFRVGFELDSNNADVIELRLKVLRGNRPISETWLYRWTTS